jgi:hypothetical protein
VRQRAASVKDPQQKQEWVRIQQRLEYLLKNGASP